jgi:hypothetical protein
MEERQWMVLAPRRNVGGSAARTIIGNHVEEVAEEKDDDEFVRHEIEALTQRCRRAEERYAERERELRRHCDAEVEKLRASHEVELARSSAAHGAELRALRTEMSAALDAKTAASLEEDGAVRATDTVSTTLTSTAPVEAPQSIVSDSNARYALKRDLDDAYGTLHMQQPPASAMDFAAPSAEPSPVLLQASPPPMRASRRVKWVSPLPFAALSMPQQAPSRGRVSGDAEAQSRRAWEREQRARSDADRDALRVASEERARAQQAAWEAELARAAAERSALRRRLEEQLPARMSGYSVDTAPGDDFDAGGYVGLNKRRGVAAYRAHLVEQKGRRAARGTRAVAAPAARPSPPRHPPGRDRLRAAYGYTQGATRSAGALRGAAAPSFLPRDEFRVRWCVCPKWCFAVASPYACSALTLRRPQGWAGLGAPRRRAAAPPAPCSPLRCCLIDARALLCTLWNERSSSVLGR